MPTESNLLTPSVAIADICFRASSGSAWITLNNMSPGISVIRFRLAYPSVNAKDLMARAIQASISAKLLLDAGDADGACNRAYYAMFDAARAALLASGALVEPEVVRTHNGLISAFSLHLVKTGLVPVELGKSINKVEDLIKGLIDPRSD